MKNTDQENCKEEGLVDEDQRFIVEKKMIRTNVVQKRRDVILSFLKVEFSSLKSGRLNHTK
jgi:hypothetical protein